MSRQHSQQTYVHLKPVVTSSCRSYLELSADILRHYFDRRLPDDFEVPGAEDLHGQDAVRLVNSEAPTKRL